MQTAMPHPQPQGAGDPEDGRTAGPVPQTVLLKDAGVMNLVDQALISMTGRDIELMFRRGTAYFQALTLFMSGSVVEKNVMWNRLTGKVREKGAVYCEPEVEVVRRGNRAAVNLGCDCSIFTRRDACPHVVALMLAWVRKRDTFRATFQPAGAGYGEDETGYGEKPWEMEARIAMASHRALWLMEELAEGLETSSRREDLDVIQQLQSLIKNCALAYESTDLTHANNNPVHLRDVLSITTSVYLGVMESIGRKYSLPFMAVHYKGLLATADRTVEMFLDGVGGTAGAGARTGSAMGQAVTPPDVGRHAGGEKNSSSTGHATAAAGGPADARGTKETSRSWDSIIDELT
ncbi:MAG: hypothetical protein QXX64_05855 [Nitrososphaera sp.]